MYFLSLRVLWAKDHSDIWLCKMSLRPKESCRDRRKATGHGQTGWCEAATSRAGRRGLWPRGSSERDLACWPGARTSGHSAVCHPPGQREADLHPELKEGVPATFGQLGCSAYPMSGPRTLGRVFSGWWAAPRGPAWVRVSASDQSEPVWIHTNQNTL